MTDEQIKAELTEEENQAWEAGRFYVIYKSLALARITIREQAHKILQQHKNLGEYPEVCIENNKLRTKNRELRERLQTVHLGRLFCGQCDAWDHDCGCSPSIIERTRAKLLEDSEAT